MRRALSLVVGVIVMLFAARASAMFHANKIVQVYAGAGGSYVQIQAYIAGQNFLNGHTLTVYNAAGTSIGTVPLANVANGADQAYVLIGTASVNAAFGVAPDFVLAAPLVQAGGKVCFDAIPITCFAWGNYTGDATDTGTPFAAFTTLAAKLTTTGGTNAAGLDGADESNKSSVDYTAVTPMPTNNNGATGGLDASAPPQDSGTSGGTDAATPPVDSGVHTEPTPPREAGVVVGDDAGSSGGGGSSSGDSGCSVHTSSSDGWSTALGLFAAASILVLSRRRRAK